jgi:COP9 signalosome complex subunit 2
MRNSWCYLVEAEAFTACADAMLCRYDFEYEEDDEDDQEAGDVDIENKYYNAKQLKLSDPQDAIAEFLGIPPLEPDKGEWGFKGLKQAIKLEFKLGQYDQVSKAELADMT